MKISHSTRLRNSISFHDDFFTDQVFYGEFRRFFWFFTPSYRWKIGFRLMFSNMKSMSKVCNSDYFFILHRTCCVFSQFESILVPKRSKFFTVIMFMSRNRFLQWEEEDKFSVYRMIYFYFKWSTWFSILHPGASFLNLQG